MAQLASPVNMHAAKTSLSKLIARVEQGEEIVIARNGRPVARLVPIAKQDRAAAFGSMRGKIWIADDFDAPLPDSFWLGEDDDDA